jgi:N-sulfoglucosamine sulfohydrolase
MQALDESGFKENTLVLFISDNGVALPFAKCDNYYASSRTPWIVRWPGVIEGGRVDDMHLISGIDYFPTILDATGINTDTELDGISHLPLYRGDDRESEPYVFTQIDNKAGGSAAPMRSTASPMRGVQSRDFNYIFNAWTFSDCIYYNNNEGITMQAMQEAAGTDSTVAQRVTSFRTRPLEEFYDLRIDPNCLINLVADPGYSNIIQKMRTELKLWMQEYSDPLLYVYENRTNEEKARERLYELYPDLEKLN